MKKKWKSHDQCEREHSIIPYYRYVSSAIENTLLQDTYSSSCIPDVMLDDNISQVYVTHFSNSVIYIKFQTQLIIKS